MLGGGLSFDILKGFELFIKNLIKTNNFYYFFYLTLYLYKGL